MLLDRRLSDARAKIARHVAERRDAQRLRRELAAPRAGRPPRPSPATGGCRPRSSRGSPRRPPAAARATPSGRGSRASSAGRSRRSSSRARRSGSTAGDRRRRRAAPPDRAPARIRPRAARRATCADRPPPNRPGSARAGRRAPRAPPPRSRRRRRPRETTRRAPGRRAAISGSGSTAPVLTDPAVPTTRNGTSPAAASASSCRRKRGHVHAELAVRRDPPDRRGAESRRGPRPSESTCAFRPMRTRGACAPARRQRPRSRTSQPAFAARAARKPTKFAMLPPLTSSPPQSTG